MTGENRPHIAIIGGGFFGATVAYVLAEAGYPVTLFEKHDDLLQAASGINQFRLHRGYHYPRSAETARECAEAEQIFLEEFPGLVSFENDHYYCIAREGSKISPEDFRAFCDAVGLEYEEAHSPVVNRKEILWSVKVREGLVRIDAARCYLRERLEHLGVALRFNTLATEELLRPFSKVVVCTYASNNQVLRTLLHDEHIQEYQYELCEKIVLELPTEFQHQSVVIMDGPFMCVDPFCDTPYHLMGNVVHAIHRSSVGAYPEIPTHLAQFINRGLVNKPPHSNFRHFIKSASQYFPHVYAARHVGSMYTIRTVLPNLDHSDARPTIVEPLSERVIRVFSGKIGNCVLAAWQVRRLITKSEGKHPQ